MRRLRKDGHLSLLEETGSAYKTVMGKTLRRRSFWIPRINWKYRVIQNDCGDFNNLSYTIHMK
jgi:hypothetical protein